MAAVTASSTPMKRRHACVSARGSELEVDKFRASLAAEFDDQVAQNDREPHRDRPARLEQCPQDDLAGGPDQREYHGDRQPHYGLVEDRAEKRRAPAGLDELHLP